MESFFCERANFIFENNNHNTIFAYMKRKCIVRLVELNQAPTNAWDSKDERKKDTTYYSIYDPQKKADIAWGKQIAITPCEDNYTKGGSDVKGYRFVSPIEMQEIVDAGIMIDVEYHNVRCSEPCGNCEEFGCEGVFAPITLVNKVIIEWKI
jgi:hypothetical protein